MLVAEGLAVVVHERLHPCARAEADDHLGRRSEEHQPLHHGGNAVDTCRVERLEADAAEDALAIFTAPVASSGRTPGGYLEVAELDASSNPRRGA